MSSKISKKYIILLFFVFTTNTIVAQYWSYSGDFYETNRIITKIEISDTVSHTIFLPLTIDYIKKHVPDSEIFSSEKRINFISRRKHPKLWHKILDDDLVTVRKENFTFNLNLLADLEKSEVKNDTNPYWQNTRGFNIYGTIGKKLSYYTDFFETQTYLVPYQDSIALATLVVRGEGSWKYFGKDLRGRDYESVSGYISYQATDKINLQFGRSKFFVGSGYRSMLLSDNTSPYPFARFTYINGKFQYSAMFTEFQSFKGAYYYYHPTKHGSFVHLSYTPLQHTEISLFEGIIWKTSDDSTYVKRFPALYFVPVPFVREAVYGMNGENNTLLGLSFRTTVFHYAGIYGQIAIDNLSKEDFLNRYAYQAGVKIYDVFANKFPFARMFAFVEYNFASPYTYSHFSTSSYTNMNQPLAHPIGAGFDEFVAGADLHIFGFSLTGKVNNISTAYDFDDYNLGRNILIPDNEGQKPDYIIVGTENPTTINLYTFRISYCS